MTETRFWHSRTETKLQFRYWYRELKLFFVELWCVVGRRLEYTFSSGKRSRQPQRSMSHLTVMLSGKPLAASTVETAQWLLLGIFVQKVFSKNLNFRYQQNKKSTKKIKPHLLCQFQMLTYQ